MSYLVPEVKECEYCKSSEIITDYFNGTTVCTSCGSVIDDTIYDMIQVNHLNYYQRKKEQNPYFANSYKKKIKKTENNRTLFRMIKQQRRYLILDQLDKANTISVISQMKNQLNLPKHIVIRGDNILRKAYHNINIMNFDAFVFACMYFAARENNYPIIINNICKDFKQRKKYLREYYVICDYLNIRPEEFKPSTFLPLLESKYDIPDHIMMEIRSILLKLDKTLYIHGKNPTGITSAVFYIVCKYEYGFPMIQSDLAEIMGTSIIIIRNRIKDLKKILPKL